MRETGEVGCAVGFVGVRKDFEYCVQRISQNVIQGYIGYTGTMKENIEVIWMKIYCLGLVPLTAFANQQKCLKVRSLDFFPSVSKRTDIVFKI